MTVDSANDYNIKVSIAKEHEAKKLCYKCNTKFTTDYVKSNTFTIKVIKHPCNTDGVTPDTAKVITVQDSEEKELLYKVYHEYDGSKTPQPKAEVEQWSKNLFSEGLFKIKSAGAEAVGGCAQFTNAYTIAKVTKKDGSTVIAKADWENIISLDAASSLLTIKEYSGASTADFDEAQIFVEVKNNHFEMVATKVATLTFKYHPCNYLGFKVAKDPKEVKLDYTSYVPWGKDKVLPEKNSVTIKKFKLKDEDLILSEDKTNCPVVDY